MADFHEVAVAASGTGLEKNGGEVQWRRRRAHNQDLSGAIDGTGRRITGSGGGEVAVVVVTGGG
ncbi:hypothetical protein M6B38_142860 [Iris pallida]|uniref:Uncharacterized protein n=1 Tax=Iris pallida TaxID=29817 RepID=A0AAX6FB66_IRIPA|nr:hypothetical protein M6B38_142860 [Iris pallida]